VVVLCAEDNFRTQARPRRTGLAARAVEALRPLLRPGPADDVWILSRDPASVVAPPGPVFLPFGCSRLDAGVTLALVVGRRADGVTEVEAHEYLAGVAVALDVVRRDVPSEHAFLARSWPTHTPVSREVVPLERVGNLDDLSISFAVDGVERQRASTADMVATAAQLLAVITAWVPLNAGDLVLTGSPPGMAVDTGEGWLASNSRLVAEIERVGRLEVTVRDPDHRPFHPTNIPQD
jgi:2-keto-4-pentenoate hydratase/2-oxohepta-3-ene-1,7-dioic acid hydratase in catechol pathway